MDTRTGELRALADIPLAERKHFIHVNRDLSELEKATMQVKLYSPCGCGSGKKFKFCCRKP